MIDSTRKKYSRQSVFFSVALGLFFLIIGKKDVCRGVVLGGVFSVINFVLLEQHLYSRIGKPKSKAILSAGISIGGRCLLMAFPLFLSIRFDRFNTLGVVLGLFAIQLTILYNCLYEFFFPPKC